MQALMAAVAALAGILLGYWLRSTSAAKEKQQLEGRLGEAAGSLAAARSEAGQAQATAAARAGFESLAAERERTIAQLWAERDELRGALQAGVEEQRRASARVSALEAELRGERTQMAEKLELLESAKQALAHQFEVLAGEVLEKKARSFAESSQSDLGNLLTPLQTQLKEFREKVEQAQSDSKTGVTRLETLIGTLGTLNQQLTEEARNLSTALRGSAKAQGDWGEFILRDLLDKAGLREGDEYKFQQSFTSVETEKGERTRTVRTDVVLYLPGGRHLVIDSKVSLNAYTDCVNATADEGRKAALKLHVSSVRGHIAGLAKAGYHRLPELEAPDFVVMFVPVEPAFLMALQADGDLWADAYKQGILLVGPTTLLYVIRIINVLWQQERQARNVREVMDRGTELYEKFVGFVTDMEVLGESLRKSDQHYTNAMKKLADGRGNLIRQVEMLKKLGLRTTKSIPKALLDRADVDQAELALAAEAEENREQ
ncbi:DNA recombination protein RmuC [Acidobacteria bacterium AB60]|nr:DNA recombination protein RmuC [Acidobacteria bacterium AB60]